MTNFSRIHLTVALFSTLLLTAACGQNFSRLAPLGTEPAPSVGLSVGEQTGDSTSPVVLPEICSALNFEKVTWPNDYSIDDQTAFALALNISGSLEGHAGWANLSNNFDGQGVSMGILNQNLGQGSLQRLWLQMRDNHDDVMQSIFSPSMLGSMYKMLDTWQSKRLFTKSSEVSDEIEVEKIPLDGPFEGVEKRYAFFQNKARSTSASVRWAKQTLYSDSQGRKFKSSWRKALKKMAAHPTYVSLQINAARYIHDRAHRYRRRLGWNQLHSYLFLFDIVVQNGSLRDKHFNKFASWKGGQKAMPGEIAEMKAMLSIRVKDSNPKWQNDVRKRKTAIIDGSGFVHGERRNFPNEYCYQADSVY